MERLKHMGLKRSFVLLAVLCLLAALLLMAGVCAVCSCIAGGYPRGGMEPSRSWRSPQWSRLVFCVC